MSVSGREAAAAGPDTRAADLRRVHGGRAHSAYDRAVAACRHAGVVRDAAEVVPKDAVGRAANALRLSARSLDALAADARCARNTAATAALAAQLAAARAGGPDAEAALRAALTASRTAAAAAGGTARGRDAALNAEAEEAERRAVTTAREAGWLD